MPTSHRLLALLLLPIVLAGCHQIPEEYVYVEGPRNGELGVFHQLSLYNPRVHGLGIAQFHTQRMVFTDGPAYGDIYHAIWDDNGTHYVVLITESGGTLGFGTNYLIDVYDTDMNYVRSGIAEFLWGCTPYALVQYTGTSDLLPDAYNGQPRLAVAFVRTRLGDVIDPELPIWIRAFDSPEREGNYANITYVEWDDGTPRLPRTGYRHTVQTLEMISAEPGLVIEPNGEINIDESFRGLFR